MLHAFQTGGQDPLVMLPSGPQVAWWRLRRSGSILYWEVSADGVRFERMKAAPAATDWNNPVLTFIEIGNPNGAASGQAHFDDVAISAMPATGWCKVADLRDDFGDGDLGSVWRSFASSSDAATVSETGGALHVGPAANSANAIAGILSADRFDLRRGSLRARLEFVSSTPGIETVFEVQLSSVERVGFVVADGELRSLHQNAMAVTSTAVAFDPEAHRFLRLADRGPDGFFWETSPDGADWTVQRQDDAGFPLESVIATFFARAVQPVSAPGVSRLAGILGGDDT
jgi:hypothetical protein